VIGLEEVIDVQPCKPRQFGTAGPISNLFQEVWKEELHVFAAEGASPGTEGATHGPGHPDCTSSDVLAIEEISTGKGHKGWYWTLWLDACCSVTLLSYVIVTAAPSELVEADGLQSKHWQRQ
jgi:hypothetical protein